MHCRAGYQRDLIESSKQGILDFQVVNQHDTQLKISDNPMAQESNHAIKHGLFGVCLEAFKTIQTVVMMMVYTCSNLIFGAAKKP